MEKRMITCKHCGERIRPDEERCPYCNAKLEVDYAKLYQAYPNKKYYLYISSKKFFIALWIVWYVFSFAVFAGSCVISIYQYSINGRGTLILTIPITVLFFLNIVLSTHIMHINFASYMIWDGNDTVTVKKIKSQRTYKLSKASYFVSRIFSVYPYHGKATHTCYLAISDDDMPMFYIYADEICENFFMHFGIKPNKYAKDKFSYFDLDLYR